MITDNNQSDFFTKASIRFHSAAGNRGDIMYVPDLLERGKNYIMSWLRDENLKEQFKDDAMMFYYNVACYVFAGGVAYADAWQKDVAQVKTGIVDTLISSQPDIMSLAKQILEIEDETPLRKVLDSMFSEFLELMSPYWDKEDPRPFLFQGLLAFFGEGITYRLNK